MVVAAGVPAAATSFVCRLQSHPQIFGQFRRVMAAFSSGKLDVAAVVSELDTLFQFHHDLLTGYRFFLPPEFRASSSSQQSRKSCGIKADMKILSSCIHFMNKVQKRFADERGVILAYLETIRALTKGKLSDNDAYDAIANIFGNENQDLVDEFELLLVGDNGGRKRFKKKKTEEGKFKKDEKNNLSPSTSDSGDEIKVRKKKALDDLNLCKHMEDEMFELDMRLSPLSTTVESAKAMKKFLEDSAAEQQHQTINIDQYFSVASLRFIRKEYKERGSFIIEKLREDPKHVLPQILEQLEPKEAELVKAREKLHKHWYGVHKKKQML